MHIDAAQNQLTAAGAPFEVIEQDGLKRYKNAFRTLPEMLRNARRDDAQEFMMYQQKRWSYQEFWRDVDALACWLHQSGIVQGDRVAIAMRNRPEWVVAFVAIASLAAVPVPLNSFGSGQELKTALDSTQPRHLICDSDRLQRLAEVVDSVNFGILQVGDELAALPATHYHSAVAEPIIELAEVNPDPKDEALILFTSGAGGAAKAVLSTHQGLVPIAV